MRSSRVNVSRESVSVALEALFVSLVPGTLTTLSRTLVPFTNVDKTAIPALFVVEDDEQDNQQQDFGLETYKLDFALWLYTPVAEGGSEAPGTAMNTALDAIDLAIRGPIAGERQTLGGLVTNCWIDGKVIKQVGIVGQGMPSVARIPVTILTGA
jgi:hypothetical protein